MGASASVADRHQCPAITDMRAHEVAAHTSIIKALRRDYPSTQALLKRFLTKFAAQVQSEDTGPGAAGGTLGRGRGKKKGAAAPDGVPHYQRNTLATEKRGFFLDMDHVTFLSERKKIEQNIDGSANVTPEAQAVVDELTKCFDENPHRCITLLKFFIQTSVQPKKGDYVFLPLSPGRGIARVKMVDLSGAREEGLHYQIIFADGFTNWVSLAELKTLPPIAELEPLQQLAMLHVACYVGDIRTVDELLHFEVDPCEEDERGNTAVQIAANADHDRILEMFATNGQPSDVAAKVAAAKEVVLHAAASECNEHTCKKLLRHGVQPHKRQADGLTAVHHAVQGGFTNIIRMCRIYAPDSAPVIREATHDESAHPTTTDLLALHGDFVVPTEVLLQRTKLVCAGSGELSPQPLLVLQVRRRAEPVPLLVLSSDYEMVKREIQPTTSSSTTTTSRPTSQHRLVSYGSSCSSIEVVGGGGVDLGLEEGLTTSRPSSGGGGGGGRLRRRDSVSRVQYGQRFTATFVGCDGTYAEFPGLVLWEPSTKKSSGGAASLNSSVGGEPGAASGGNTFAATPSFRSFSNVLDDLDEMADTSTSYAHLLAGTRRCHSHVHSREYFLEAMEVCLKQNGRRKPSAVPFDACAVLLRAAASVRDARMHDLVSSWMLFKWPERRSEVEAVPLLHRAAAGGVVRTAAGAADNSGEQKSSSSSAVTSSSSSPNQDPSQNKTRRDAPATTSKATPTPTTEGKNQGRVRRESKSREEEEEEEKEEPTDDVVTPFVRTPAWAALRSFLSEKDELPNPLSLRHFSGLSFDAASSAIEAWKKTVIRFGKLRAADNQRSTSSTAGSPVSPASADENGALSSSLGGGGGGGGVDQASASVFPHSTQRLPSPAECLSFMNDAEDHQEQLDQQREAEAFKATPLGQLLEQGRKDRMRQLKKAEAQAEGRRLMKAKSPGAVAAAGKGAGAGGAGSADDARPGESPSPTQWISPERAGDLALQVMLQDEEDADVTKDLELCTHGRGRPAFGQYLGEAHK